MKRPLLCVSLMFVVAVYFSLLIWPISADAKAEDGSAIQFTGKIYQKEYKLNSKGQISQILYLEALEDSSVKVQCYLATDGDVLRSDKAPIGGIVRVNGTVRLFNTATNPGEFDSQQYYQTLKISYRLQKAQLIAYGGKKDVYRESLWKLRYRFEDILDKTLSYSDAAIMKGILLGDKAFMDGEQSDLYKRSGIIHILAVSGLHISIIGMGLYKLLRKVSLHKVLAVTIAVFTMWSYGEMCGMSPSAYRAIFMFSLNIFSHIINRTYDMLTAMAIAGVLLVIENPLYLHHSGFMMSFGAVMAIGFVVPVLQKDVEKGLERIMICEKNRLVTISVRIVRSIIVGITGSIGILLFTLPVYMNYYYTLPVYGPVLNIIVLPLMPVLMIAGILCMLLGLINIYVARVPGLLIHLVLKLFEYSCRGSGKAPGGTLYLGHAELWQVVIYLITFGIFIWLFWQKKLRHNMLLRYGTLLIGLMALCYRHSYDLKLTFLDVGQGDGIVISCGKEAYLIDGGSTTKNEVGKYQIKPYLCYEGIGSLKAVILTHEDEDHMSGMLELIEETTEDGIKIQNLILPDIDKSSRKENYQKLLAKAKQYQIPVSYISRGMVLGTGDRNLKISCLGPVKGMKTDEPNEYSTILYIKYQDFSALLSGDVEGAGQRMLVSYIENLQRYNGNYESVDVPDFENITLLKVAHHGSRYTTDEKFLSLINPKVAIISCGKGNTYGHPHKELLERLEKYQASIYITKDSGAITVICDKKKCFVKEYLKD